MTKLAQPSQSEFTPLPLAGIIPDALPEVDLFLPAVAQQKATLYRAKGVPIDMRDLAGLRDRGLSELWVNRDDAPAIDEFLASNLATILGNEEHSPRDRLKLLNQVVGQTLKQSMSCDDPSAAVAATHDLSQHLVDISLHPKLPIADVAKVAKHDFCTFTHSANVASYCTMLLRALGVTDPDELREIAAAGMLHDLGKLEIPTTILCKPGRLTAEEFNTVKLHPTRGFQMLRKELSHRQLLLVYQHHEKIDGSGYPVGCVGSEMHLWSKVCAVADVFEALTGKRPYRRANTTSEALTIMRRGVGSHFDQEIFSCWQRHFLRGIDE
ncbi:HD-GYP domain-containing protein [Anatilimnocola sp. NA78]|uniref:HD-GYP domain-containing protein n=1 Tax=Anatilimnocola sp. NA78 TaxID=3415683 RepID=UPI003CE5926D